jgi:hypothetical protein
MMISHSITETVALRATNRHVLFMDIRKPLPLEVAYISSHKSSHKGDVFMLFSLCSGMRLPRCGKRTFQMVFYLTIIHIFGIVEYIIN